MLLLRADGDGEKGQRHDEGGDGRPGEELARAEGEPEGDGELRRRHRGDGRPGGKSAESEGAHRRRRGAEIEELAHPADAEDDEEQPGFVTASSLADLDPGEFRKFLETVTVEEFASSLREHLAAEEDVELEDLEGEDDAEDEESA